MKISGVEKEYLDGAVGGPPFGDFKLARNAVELSKTHMDA